jgi:hypothetical protein
VWGRVQLTHRQCNLHKSYGPADLYSVQEYRDLLERAVLKQDDPEEYERRQYRPRTVSSIEVRIAKRAAAGWEPVPLPHRVWGKPWDL